MPRKVEWFLRLPSAMDALRAMDAPVVDRAAVERLFHVSPRQALRILRRLGAFSAGRGLMLDRVELIGKLERLDQGDFGAERRRWDRLEDHLTAVQRELAARRVPIAASRETLGRRFADLPPGIHLAPGRLVVEFTGAEELLARLFELAHAISNDFARFEEIAQGESRS